jgi:nitrate/nitrite transporter NarK
MVALIPQLAGVRLAGTAAGVTNAFWQLGSTVVPVVLGVVFQSTHSFFAAFATLAAGPLLGMLLMIGMREDPAGRPADEAAATPVGRPEKEALGKETVGKEALGEPAAPRR